MLLLLPGACAVVGPFQGPEWDPVRGLFTQDCSCRDPRCCGNLLVLCLFLIWQVRHYWHHVTRTRPSKRNVIKVPLQRWIMPFMRCETFFRLTPEFFSSVRFRVLDAGVQQRAQKQRWGYRRSLLESWTQYLFSPRHLFQGPSWGVHTPSVPDFCTSSFSNTCPLFQDSSWEAWQVRWCLRHVQTHSTLDTCPRIERLLVRSQKMVPLEHVLRTRSCPSPMTLAISLPSLPSAQRLQFCSGEFPPNSSKQQMGVAIQKCWNSPQETWAPSGENQTVGKEYTKETQAPRWANQKESRGLHIWELQACGSQLPKDFGKEDRAESKALECKNQQLVISETDGEILIPEHEKQMGIENRTQIEELGKEIQREARSENPSETLVHMEDNKEQLKCKIDAETQTPGWGYQDNNGSEDALEIQTFERKNEKEPRGEEEGEIQAHGLGKQGQTGDENAEEAQTPEWAKQNHIGVDTGAEIEVEEGRNQDQVGNEDAMPTLTSGRENLEDIKQDSAETQALRWGKQEHSGSENITEIWAPVGEEWGQGVGENARETQASSGNKQKPYRQEVQMRWGIQDLVREDHTVQCRMSERKFREIREEDWVVIQTSWWGNPRLTVSETNREFKISWENQNQFGGEHRAEIQAAEEYDQRKDEDEDHMNTLSLEAEDQGPLRNKTDVETHPTGRKSKEQLGHENGTDIQALGERNPREFKGEDSTKTQELGAENQGQLGNESFGKIFIPQWKNQKHTQGQDSANIQIHEAGKWGELRSKIDGETHSAGWNQVEQAGAEILLKQMRNPRETEWEDGTETRASGEGSQSQLAGEMDKKIHLVEWKNQKQMGGEDETEIQAPKNIKQREAEGEEVVKTQRSEREDKRQLESVTGGSHYPEMGSWGQTRGKNVAGSQGSSEKRNQREAGIKDGRKIHRLRKNQRLLRGKVHKKTCSSEYKVHRKTCSSEYKVHRKTYSSEWKNQEENGGGNAAENQLQGKRNLRRTTGGDNTKMQAPVEDDQGQPRREIGGAVQTRGQGNQNKGGDAAAKVWNVGSQRKSGAKYARGSPTPRRGHKGQTRGKDPMRAILRSDCSRGERPTGRKHSLAWPWSTSLVGSGHRPLGQEQTVAVHGVASAPCTELKPQPHLGNVYLLAPGEGEHLTRQGIAPAGEHGAGMGPVSQQAQTGSRRRPQRHKGVEPGKTYSFVQQPQNSHSVAAPLGMPSACSSVPCAQALQAATALVGVPTILTIRPKWPVLKKSQRLLLESLMRRRIAHLKWGLPRRILESYLIFNFLGPCSLPLAGARLPELFKGHMLQRQQENHCEAQGSMPGLKSPERFQRVLPTERKNSKLSTQARWIPHRSEPVGCSLPPEKPRRTKPSGGPRRPQIQEEALRARLHAPRYPKSLAESMNWCSPESVREPSGEHSRGIKMIRPRVSQMAEKTSSIRRTSSSGVGHDHWKKERIFQEASELPGRRECEHPIYWRRGILEPVEGKGARQQPSSCSTDSSSFKGSLHSKAAKLSMTFLSKMSWSPQLVNPTNPALNPSLSDPNPLPRMGNSHAGEDSIGVHTALEQDHQPPELCCAGAALPRTKRPQGQRLPGSPNGPPQNPQAPKKFGFMKHLRYFLFHCGLKK